MPKEGEGRQAIHEPLRFFSRTLLKCKLSFGLYPLSFLVTDNINSSGKLSMLLHSLSDRTQVLLMVLTGRLFLPTKR